ncbi:MAG: hypothetical protein Q8K66_12250 [Sediminibacterium sp.]|nr:hypothetical protein [Sediminibacterium sp.]MDP3127081.1 hypothetical protein [Sediminibacterium sp.]
MPEAKYKYHPSKPQPKAGMQQGEYLLGLKLRQFQYETDTWKRLIRFIMDENVQMKNRLSEVLKNTIATSFLEEVESFQSCFIKEDELIGLLRSDITELDKLLATNIFEDKEISKEVTRKLNRLRNNIVNVETQFNKLKMEFNCYLSEKTLTE